MMKSLDVMKKRMKYNIREGREKSPFIGVILLIVGVIWLLNNLGSEWLLLSLTVLIIGVGIALIFMPQ